MKAPMCLGVDFLKILGATFGATLYFDFVRFCATECNVEIKRNLFISRYLFYFVQHRARWFSDGKNWTQNPPTLAVMGVRPPLPAPTKQII